MTSVEIERFFGGVIQPNTDNNNNNNNNDDSTTTTTTAPNYDISGIKLESSDIVLLSGPLNCGKTSLLFQYGYTYAKQGYTVLFICNKKKFTQNLPYFPSNFIKDDFYLKRLKIKYIENDTELRNYLLDFPSLTFLPDLILIDDISYYFGTMLYERNVSLGKTLAFIKETLNWIKNQKKLKYQNIFDFDNLKEHELVSLDCKIIISDISTILTDQNSNQNQSHHQQQHQHQHQQQQQQQQHMDHHNQSQVPQQLVQQLLINGINTYTSISNPKFLYIIQRWINLVIVINEVLSINNPPISTATTTTTNTTTSNQHHHHHHHHHHNIQISNKKYILSILRYKDKNIINNSNSVGNNNIDDYNFLKDYIHSYNVKFNGSNNQNNSFTLDSIQIPKQIINNNNNIEQQQQQDEEEHSPTQPLM